MTGRRPSEAASEAPPEASIILRVGLTGGIASGKSTVDGMLEMFGAHIIDADAIVHELLQPAAPEYDDVVRRFGKGILRPDGTIDRRALAAIVFHDAGARADLNAIIHPGVTREESREFARVELAGGGVVVTDAALLVETGRYREYDRVVVVACEESLQLSRLLARDPDMHADEAEARIHAQASVRDKVAVADYVIDTSGSLSDTEHRAHDIYLLLHEDLDAKRAGQPLPRRTRPDLAFLDDV